jgi:DMSO/TMAO reductase YedYZ heme-binding membrane subunit
MKTTRAVTLVVWAVLAGVLGSLYGIFQVTHGHALPVASVSTIFTMPGVSIVLALLALPIYRYRRAMINLAKLHSSRNDKNSVAGTSRPVPLNPFYAVRVLLLAKSTSITAAFLGGWQAGLVVLQLSTPVISASVWYNVIAFVGCAIAVAVGLAVEQICKLPDDPNPPVTTDPAGAV